MGIRMKIKATEGSRWHVIMLMVLSIASLWAPKVAANDVTSLVCSGTLSTPGKESPTVGVTLSIRTDSIGVSGIPPFDGNTLSLNPEKI